MPEPARPVRAGLPPYALKMAYGRAAGSELGLSTAEKSTQRKPKRRTSRPPAASRSESREGERRRVAGTPEAPAEGADGVV